MTPWSGATINYVIDGQNRWVGTTAYDSFGRVSTLTDPLHSVGFTYDGANRPTKVLLPDTNSILSSFDPNGNVLSITPPGRLAHAFSYQGADLETDYTPPAVDALATGHQKTGYNL